EKDGKGGSGYDTATGKFEQRAEYTWRSAGFSRENNHPVVNISWNDAKAFCDWLSKKEGKTYRLLTEAEWEYACRAGTTTRYHFGVSEALLGTYAWFVNSAEEIKEKYAHEVALKPANPFGLYDMHGNVFEWCQDNYAEK